MLDSVVHDKLIYFTPLFQKQNDFYLWKFRTIVFTRN